jgi:hypothetical protein
MSLFLCQNISFLSESSIVVNVFCAESKITIYLDLDVDLFLRLFQIYLIYKHFSQILHQ